MTAANQNSAHVHWPDAGVSRKVHLPDLLAMQISTSASPPSSPLPHLGAACYLHQGLDIKVLVHEVCQLGEAMPLHQRIPRHGASDVLFLHTRRHLVKGYPQDVKMTCIQQTSLNVPV